MPKISLPHSYWLLISGTILVALVIWQLIIHWQESNTSWPIFAAGLLAVLWLYFIVQFFFSVSPKER